VNHRANPGRGLDIAKIAAVRAAWIRAAEASDISGLIALATDGWLSTVTARLQSASTP
jgi:hypothetical protein